MFDKAIQFLKDHKEIALATCEGNLDYVECCHDSDIPERAQMSLAAPAFPKLRIFQIMKQEGHVLYFPLLQRRQSIGSYARIPMLRYWPTQIIYPLDVQGW